MENISMRPTALRYGAVGALLIIVFGLLLFVTGISDPAGGKNSWIQSSFQLIVCIATMVLATRYHRDEVLGGYISMGRITALGGYLGLIIGILTGIWSYVFFAFLQPNLMTQMLETTREQMIARGTPSEQIDQAMAMTSMFMQPGVIAVTGVCFTVILMVITAIGVGFFMKKTPEFG